MRKLEILDSQIETFSGVSAKTGKPFTIHKQIAFLHTDKAPYPEKTELMLKDGQPAYAIGMYELHPESVKVDRNGRMTIDPILVRLAEVKKAS